MFLNLFYGFEFVLKDTIPLLFAHGAEMEDDGQNRDLSDSLKKHIMPKFLSIGFIPEPLLHFPEHTDKSWEIVLYTHGQGRTRIAKQWIPFAPGTIICMPPGIPQEEISEEGYRNIYIGTDEFPFSSPKEPKVYQDSAQEEFLSLSTLLLKEHRFAQKNSDFICQHLFDAMILLFERWSDKPRCHPAVDRLRHLLFDNIGNSSFELSSSIGRLGLSPDHLRKLFMNEIGKSPLDYLATLRIQEACHLMRIGGLKVKEIAARVGFEDPYYFSRQFKKYTGQSPEHFMRSI